MYFVEFIPLYDNLPQLTYATALSSGIDLTAHIDNLTGYLLIEPGRRMLIRTGYKCKLQRNYEGQIRSRSGLALKYGIHVLNSPGTIDADYDLEIGVILHNSDPYIPYKVFNGDKIAQFVISPVVRELEYLTDNNREGGFGSTGK